jgi:predicted TIM-barrel fold metal-dependent hydrolase
MTARRVDAHHHVWDVSRHDYPWMNGPWADPIRRTLTVDELAAAALPHGIGETVVVQALADVAETRELFALGSDRPVCLLAADYGRVVDLAERTLAGLPADHVFGDNARRIYRLTLTR